MHRHIQSAGRYLSSILAVCILALLGSAAAVRADTDTDISQFDIVSASSSQSKWTTRGCTDDDDIDDGCYVEVRADSSLRDDIEAMNEATAEENWAAYFNAEHDLRNRDSYSEKNEDFNDFWEGEGATVTWPQVDPREDFEATGFCKSGDWTCSININICYNADECDDRRSNDDEFEEDNGRMADFFDNTRRCLFDVSDSRFTECINDALRDIYDALERQGRVSYSALEDRLEDQGVEIERYSTSLRNVEDTAYFGREYLEPRPPPPVRPLPQPSTPPVSYLSGPTTTTSKPWVDQVVWPTIGGYAPVRSGDFILVHFTRHLEAQPYTRICGTSAGCINMVGSSRHFAYMGNISIVNSNWNTISCLRSRGYHIGRGTVLAFDDPNLQACDHRMATANSYCPAGGEGAKAELLQMYNLGLVSNLLTPSMAQGLQNDLATASTVAPRCLCNAGFHSSDLVVSTSATNNPWAAGASVNYSSICG